MKPSKDDSQSIDFCLNGERRRVHAHGMERLLDVIREPLGATGTKEGCGEGECGACAVTIDGQLVNSCLVPVAQVAGCHVHTVESLGSPQTLSILQKCFLELGAAQCGICTPGMLMAAHAFIESRSERVTKGVAEVPTDAEVREAIAGNLCRCTGYVKIIDAIVLACARVRAKDDR